MSGELVSRARFSYRPVASGQPARPPIRTESFASLGRWLGTTSVEGDLVSRIRHEEVRTVCGLLLGCYQNVSLGVSERDSGVFSYLLTVCLVDVGSCWVVGIGLF